MPDKITREQVRRMVDTGEATLVHALSEPYFRKDFDGALAYVEFRIGDYSHELGILDRRYIGPTPERQGGTVAYWAVDDVQAVVVGGGPAEPLAVCAPGEPLREPARGHDRLDRPGPADAVERPHHHRAA